MAETTTLGNVIDGKKISEVVLQELKSDVEKLKEKTGGLVPGLTVLLVGERKDSQTYVRMKQRAAEQIGIKFTLATFPENVSQSELEEYLEKTNRDDSVHGVIVQLPLPNHIDKPAVLAKVSPHKDVDGLLPESIGSLAQRPGEPSFVSCTPQGCLELLERTGIEISGKNAVVLGRSQIVGIPAALLLLRRDATVTVCHSKTKNMKEIVREADIVVAAVGVPELVKGDWIKPGAAVIDVGINAIPDSTKAAGYRLVGDVAYAECKERAGHITPVPGGVGPMTVAMLLKNTVLSFKRQYP